MQADYWDTLAASFDREVSNPLANDLHGRILASVLNASSLSRSVADIGCGIGRLTPTLAKQFRSVLAIDLSEPCLQIARKRCRDISNVDYLQHDLTTPLPDIDQVDVGVCLNVALLQNYHPRMRLHRNVTQLIRPGGCLILLVPSMESVLLTVHRLVLWNLEESKTYRQAAAAASHELGFTARSVHDGVVETGGTLTKHYLREELELLMQELGHQVESIEKVEYPWHTEFEDPPVSMEAPYPWDWLVVSRPG